MMSGPIPESAYKTERSASKQYKKEDRELRKLNPGKKGWLGSGKQADNIASDERMAKEKTKSDAAFKSIGMRTDSTKNPTKSKPTKTDNRKRISTKK